MQRFLRQLEDAPQIHFHLLNCSFHYFLGVHDSYAHPYFCIHSLYCASDESCDSDTSNDPADRFFYDSNENVMYNFRFPEDLRYGDDEVGFL